MVTLLNFRHSNGLNWYIVILICTSLVTLNILSHAYLTFVLFDEMPIMPIQLFYPLIKVM